MEMLHFKDLGDTKVSQRMQLGVSLVIDNYFYVASAGALDTSPLYAILKQLDDYLSRYCILKILGYRVSFGC